VNPSNELVDDFSPCEGQTHAEKECSLGLYRPEIRHLFKRGLEELDLGIPKSMLRTIGFVWTGFQYPLEARRIFFHRWDTHIVLDR
jgi:hypothetical protein